MIKTIVIATDGSGQAEKAVAFGADIAEKYGARVVLVHSLLRKEISENLREMARVEHLVGEEGKAMAKAVAAIPEGRFPASIVFEEKEMRTACCTSMTFHLPVNCGARHDQPRLIGPV